MWMMMCVNYWVYSMAYNSRHHLPNCIISCSHTAHYCSRGDPRFSDCQHRALSPLCHSFQESLTFLPQTEMTRGSPSQANKNFSFIFCHSLSPTIFLEFLIGCTNFSILVVRQYLLFLPTSQIKSYIKMCGGYNGIKYLRQNLWHEIFAVSENNKTHI